MKLTLGKIEIEFSLSINWEKKYMKEVKQALREGRRLQAVKIYKDATGKGLRESKEAIDLLCPKYYKDYKPVEKWFPNPLDTYIRNPDPGVNTIPDVETFHSPKPMFGACKASTDLFTNIMNPEPLFVGTLEQCQEWAEKESIVCTMIGLNQDEVNKYIRNKLSQPNPNVGSETPPFYSGERTNS